jgi:hypothetical protein
MQVQKIIEKADKNGDGKISYAEFVLCMTEADQMKQTQYKPVGRRRSYDEADDPKKKNRQAFQQNKAASLKHFFGGRAPVSPSDADELV